MRLGGLILTLILLLGGSVSAEIIPGQAVSWTDFSHITCLAISANFAYFGTTEGILRYHRYENQWYDPITISDGLPGGLIHRIAVPIDDAWITVETDEGIYIYETALERWFLETDFPYEYYQDSRPQLPLPIMFMPFGFTMDPEGFISDDRFRDWQITALLDDQYSTIFIGSWGLGPFKSDNTDLQAEMIPYGLLQKRTDAIYMDGDSIWLAGNAGEIPIEYRNARFGATLFDRANLSFEYLEPRFIHGFDSEVIYDIDGDDKNIYFAGRQGLTVMLRRENRFFILLSRVYIVHHSDSYLAVMVFNGLASNFRIKLSSIFFLSDEAFLNQGVSSSIASFGRADTLMAFNPSDSPPQETSMASTPDF